MKILISVIFVFLLSACDPISDAQFKKATQLCENHQGVNYLRVTIEPLDVSVKCKDGTSIESKI